MKKQMSILSAALIAAALTGCSSSRAVDDKIAEVQIEANKKIESVMSQVEELQKHQTSTDAKIEQLSQESREALRRAQEAGVLAKGKVMFEQAFSDDRVKFNLDSADLSKDAKEALDQFAGRVKALSDPYYIEIQGHTDNTGSASANQDLGQHRADGVRLYLSRQHQLPLNRMSTISYGDSLPIQDNKTKAGRAANRRVVLVVLE